MFLGGFSQLLRCHLNDRPFDASLHAKNRWFSGIGQIPPVRAWNPLYEADPMGWHKPPTISEFCEKSRLFEGGIVTPVLPENRCFWTTPVSADAKLTQAADFRWPTPSVGKPARRNDFNHFAQGQSRSAAWVKRSSAATPLGKQGQDVEDVLACPRLPYLGSCGWISYPYCGVRLMCRIALCAW